MRTCNVLSLSFERMEYSRYYSIVKLINMFFGIFPFPTLCSFFVLVLDHMYIEMSKENTQRKKNKEKVKREKRKEKKI